MKKTFGLILFGGFVTAGMLAEQTAPAPPQNPAPSARPDGRRHEVRTFDFRMGGPDESSRILPPGAWWKDQDLAKRIELTADQQKKIDDAFLQNKITLIHMHASLEEEELLLGPMLDANPIDQGKVLGQISKIADTRADLEKANAKMLLQIRGVLNQQQWTKLQQERPGMRQHFIFRTPDGPHSFNFVVPDADALRMQLQNMPAIDADKIRAQMQAALKNMPRLEPDKLREQLRSLPPLPALDTPLTK